MGVTRRKRRVLLFAAIFFFRASKKRISTTIPNADIDMDKNLLNLIFNL